MSELRPVALVIAAVGNHLSPDAWGLGDLSRYGGLANPSTFPAAAPWERPPPGRPIEKWPHDHELQGGRRQVRNPVKLWGRITYDKFRTFGRQEVDG